MKVLNANNDTCLVHQIYLSIDRFDSTSFKVFSHVQLITQDLSLSLQAVPCQSIGRDECKLHSKLFHVLSGQSVKVKSLNTSPEQLEHVVFTVSPLSHEKSLNHLTLHLKKVKNRTLFAKSSNESDDEMDWLYPVLQNGLWNRSVSIGTSLAIELLGEIVILNVVELNHATDEQKCFTINENTAIRIRNQEITNREVNATNFDSQTNEFLIELSKTLGGLEQTLRPLMQNLDIVFSNEFLSVMYIPRCFIVWGLEGTGKTTLKNKIVKEYERRGIHTVSLTGSQVWTLVERGQISELEHILFHVQTATLICIDDFEMVAGKDLMETQMDNIVVHQAFNLLHQLLDEVNGTNVSKSVIVFTRNVDSVHASFRVHGRLDREIYLPVPGNQQRHDILRIYLSKLPISQMDDKEDLVERLNALTPGFVGKDIERLARMALFHSLSQNTTESDAYICWKDFEYALRVVRPSQISDLGTSVPAIAWEQFGGYEAIKQRCKEIMYWPLEHPASFERHGLPTCSGMLLYGSSGCGKTLLVRCLASLGRMNYISIKCPEIFSKYTGETEEIIRGIFKKARQLEPCVLVFDELDALAGSRDLEEASSTDGGASSRALSQLLNEMDGIQSRKNVFLVGCTNRKDMIDPAVLRPGRLDQLIEVPLPTQSDRVAILQTLQKYGQVNGKAMPMDAEVIDNFPDYASRLEGKTGADIRSICREAALEALREDKSASIIHPSHMEKALLSHVKNI